MTKRGNVQRSSQAGGGVSLDQFMSLEAEQKAGRTHVALLFGDLVGSTEVLARVGDLKWMELVSAYYSLIRKEHQRFEGRHLETAGDGFVAHFSSALDAVKCASAILQRIKSLGLKLRLGIHAGECYDMDGQMIGLTVHVGARIAAAAAADEVLVSDAVKNLIADSKLLFLDRGSHNLRGVPGEWRLFLACCAE